MFEEQTQGLYSDQDLRSWVASTFKRVCFVAFLFAPPISKVKYCDSVPCWYMCWYVTWTPHQRPLVTGGSHSATATEPNRLASPTHLCYLWVCKYRRPNPSVLLSFVQIVGVTPKFKILGTEMAHWETGDTKKKIQNKAELLPGLDQRLSPLKLLKTQNTTVRFSLPPRHRCRRLIGQCRGRVCDTALGLFLAAVEFLHPCRQTC